MKNNNPRLCPDTFIKIDEFQKGPPAGKGVEQLKVYFCSYFFPSLKEKYIPLSTGISSASSIMADIFLPQYQALPGAMIELIKYE